MSDSVVYSLICILLVIAGIAVGGVVGSDLSTVDSLQKMLSIFASIATIAGIIVAIKSLTAWRKQFTHQKLDKILDDLESEIHPLVDSYVDSWFAKDHYLLSTKGKDLTIEEENKLLSQKNEKSRPVIFRIMEYANHFKKLAHYVPIEDSNPLSPKYISSISREIHSKIEKDARNGFPLSGENFVDIEGDICQTAANTFDEMLDSLYDIRRQYLPAQF
ncbi:MAG: hypothetical protein MK214_16590 [Thalassotalea sp.]|nr:hypothetical protein [Thalassotalea sp.]